MSLLHANLHRLALSFAFIQRRPVCRRPLGPAAPLTPGGEAPRCRPGAAVCGLSGATGPQSRRTRGQGPGAGPGSWAVGGGTVPAAADGSWPPSGCAFGGAVGTGDCDRHPQPSSVERPLSTDDTKGRESGSGSTGSLLLRFQPLVRGLPDGPDRDRGFCKTPRQVPLQNHTGSQ